MSEIMEVDDFTVAALKSPSVGTGDEFFDAVDEGKRLITIFTKHRRLFSARCLCLTFVADIISPICRGYQ